MPLHLINIPMRKCRSDDQGHARMRSCARTRTGSAPVAVNRHAKFACRFTPLSFGPTHLAPVLAQLARRHPRLQVHTSYSDRFVDIVGEGFDCAIRVGHLSDSNLIVRRIGPIHGKLVASPIYVREHGAPDTPDQLLAHQCLVQGTETWNFIDGDKTIAVHPQGRFQADNGTALAAAAVAGLGIAALPDFLTEKELASGALLALMLSYPLAEGGIFIVRPPAHYPARKVRVLTELLIEHFG